MATTQAPIVPTRPIKAQDTPKIPPRPARRGIERSNSPSRDRFAPSPLDSILSKSPSKSTFSNGHSLLSVANSLTGDLDLVHPGSVDLPSVGQEGSEYAAVAETISKAGSTSSRSASPEHTRTVADDMKIYAPKPSLPAASAKERVSVVTRTDSEKAASFGIGQASQAPSQAASHEATSEDGEDDEQGIPAIGRQVPMYPNAGDVQAPTPAEIAAAAASEKNHSRKKSARGFSELPPDSYGLHGHGVIPSDKLERAYYSKHPELVQKEHTPHHADRARDYSLPSADLNKIVRETANRTRADPNDTTPSEQVGWQAIDESSSRPASAATSPTLLKSTIKKNPEISFSAPPEDTTAEADGDAASGVIHVEDPASSRRKSVMFSEDESDSDQLIYENEAPILALDELAKDPSAYDHEPAVRPRLERSGSSFDGQGTSSRNASRPNSRPSSIFRDSHITEETVADDKDEYEPLFEDDGSKAPSKSHSSEDAPAPRFPSRDIWEDAPNSAHYTAEVNTPDMQTQPDANAEGIVIRRAASNASAHEDETPAQAFARHQEELAEQEIHGAETFAENRKPHRPTSWTPAGPGAEDEAAASGISTPASLAPSAAAPASKPTSASTSSSRRPGMNRFPSRDVWEDAPESLQLQTEVSNPQAEEVPSPADAIKSDSPQQPQVPQRPAVPSRPKPKSVDGAAKPQVPSRPVRQQLPVAVEQPEAEAESAAAVSSSPSKAKPAVPARPFGGKIAALQATFMSDLNKKLKIGPQAPKKDEPEPSAEAAEEAAEKVKAPLVDARKGRARGPQRRAPAARPAAVEAAPAPASSSAVTLGFSTTMTLYSIDPEEGNVSVPSPASKAADPVEPVEPSAAETEPVAVPTVETAAEITEEKEAEIKIETETEAPVASTEEEAAAKSSTVEAESETTV